MSTPRYHRFQGDERVGAECLALHSFRLFGVGETEEKSPGPENGCRGDTIRS